MITDTYYRGYRLSTDEHWSTHIYRDYPDHADHIDTVTLHTKGKCLTTLDAAKDIVDGWLNAP